MFMYLITDSKYMNQKLIETAKKKKTNSQFHLDILIKKTSKSIEKWTKKNVNSSLTEGETHG